MTDLIESQIQETCTGLAGSFQGILSWKWDRRFETVLAEFRVDQKDQVRSVLERYLNCTYDSSNVGNGPDMVRAIETYFGGLWPGQLLFTSDPKGETLVFGTWWPWADGKEISIRIGVTFRDFEDPRRDQGIQLFKTWFGF